MFPWVILRLWSLAGAFSVLFGAKTPTELVSVFVLLHCQLLHNSSTESMHRQAMKALNTHTLICTHIKSVRLFLKTHAHCPSPSSFLKHTHPQVLTQRHTDSAPFGHIFSLLCQGVRATCHSMNALSLMWLHQFVRVFAEEAISVHTWSPKSVHLQNMSVFVHGWILICVFESVFHKVFLSVINNRESWIEKWKQSNWQSHLWWFGLLNTENQLGGSGAWGARRERT